MTKRSKIRALRLNECGDFRHQGDADKAEMLARHLSKHGISVYCYTARRDLDFSECEHLTVNGSGWMADLISVRRITWFLMSYPYLQSFINATPKFPSERSAQR